MLLVLRKINRKGEEAEEGRRKAKSPHISLSVFPIFSVCPQSRLLCGQTSHFLA
jgi:hypothetical protein